MYNFFHKYVVNAHHLLNIKERMLKSLSRCVGPQSKFAPLDPWAININQDLVPCLVQTSIFCGMCKITFLIYDTIGQKAHPRHPSSYCHGFYHFEGDKSTELGQSVFGLQQHVPFGWLDSSQEYSAMDFSLGQSMAVNKKSY